MNRKFVLGHHTSMMVLPSYSPELPRPSTICVFTKLFISVFPVSLFLTEGGKKKKKI